MKKVLVVGLGQLGLPVAKYIRGLSQSFEVYGFDIRKEAMEHALNSAGISKCVDFRGFDVYVICIATHKQDDIFLPQTEGILSIVDRISREGKNGALVSIESTIPKGTSRKVSEILDHRLHVVHAPHRWYAKEEAEHGVNQPRAIGGVEKCCLDRGLQFYGDGRTTNLHTAALHNARGVTSSSKISSNGSSLGIPMHPLPNVELAELAKVIENAHRFLQIAFAEELYLYCEANNLDFFRLRAALNTKWNVQILEPREGIGGHCLPKDTRMFLESSQAIKSKILTAAMEADMQYREHRGITIENRLKVLDYAKKEELMNILQESESPSVKQQPVVAAPTLQARSEV